MNAPNDTAMVTPHRGRLGPAGAAVDRRLTQLQQRFLAGDSWAVSALARLRRGVGKPAGSVPDIWELTLAGVPLPARHTDEPTWNEIAAHTAITLYALHQQSKSDAMYRAGQSFGEAVRTLADHANSEEAVLRRFQAAGTASTPGEFVQHARGLITQLRSAGIPLDYAEFADQLVSVQRPGGLDRVRLTWGRDYYRHRSDAEKAEHDNADSEPA